jgi:DNA polymerase (family 10)
VLDKLDIARALDEISVLLELSGENRYKARAYERGARAVEGINDDIGRLVDEQRLTEVAGIGDTLAEQVAELWSTGRSSVLERLRSSVPPGSVELAQVPGLTIKRIRALHDALGVQSVEDLKRACEQQKLRSAPGFGPRTEQKICEALRQYNAADKRLLLVDALDVARRLLERVRALPSVARAELAGDARRYEETVQQLAIVVACSDEEALFRHIARLPEVASVDAASASAQLAGGTLVTVRVVSEAAFGAALIIETGPPAHVAVMKEQATRRGLLLDERGVHSPSGVATSAEEADVYAALGVQLIAPELRAAVVEVEALTRAAPPAELITLEDLRGAVHCHTVYSDGKNTIEEMARAAEALGHRYITITDHSPSAFYARGVTLDRLRRQWDEIAEVQERVSIRILRGTESDILADGALDYPDEVLEKLDIVIASIHSRHQLDAARMTDRVLAAMRHPVFKIWGHPLGRLVTRRPPIDCDVLRILDAIATSRAAIEINADPYRLDLPPEWIAAARERGIRFVISADAHSMRGLGVLHFGVGMARRGALTRLDVLNTLDAESFQSHVRPAA